MFRRRTPSRAVALAMLHVGRCGSTVVCRMLSGHPEITWDYEIFEPRVRESLPEPAELAPRELIARRRSGHPGHYGFETKYLQSHHLGSIGMALADYIEMLTDLGFGFVALHRRNYLRRVVSGAVGRESGTWHVKDPSAHALRAITLDPSAVPFGPPQPLLDVFTELAEGEQALRLHLPAEALWLTYEADIAPDPRIAYRKICQQYGVTPTDAEPSLYPTNPFPLADLVRNFDEVADLLAGTEYEWMLAD